ncbi:MAG: GrdX family protein [Oscillospiraceae bacterium]|nr:GrdX family protein [Oscillospiraceae bacterium]
MDILITNNPMVHKYCDGEFRIEFLDDTLTGILLHVRDLIHKGHTLLTHPLSGSIKPNETPYKSVILSAKCGNTDERSVRIIGECILVAQKFNPRDIPEYMLKDMQVVDYSLIRSAIDARN